MDRFVWDEAKKAENIRIRGINFAMVHQFDWDAAAIQDDTRFDYGEKRSRAFGSIDAEAYCVVFASRVGHFGY